MEKESEDAPSSSVMASMVRGIWESMLCWRPPKLVARALSRDCITDAPDSCGDGRSWQATRVVICSQPPTCSSTVDMFIPEYWKCNFAMHACADLLVPSVVSYMM